MAGTPGVHLEISTTAMASNGRAIGRDPGGKVVFVGGALPGERVEVRLTSTRRRYSSAEAVAILEGSPDRIAPPCPELARGCGGCPWQHIEPGAQRRLKSEQIAEALTRIGKVEAPPLNPTVLLGPWAFRTTIRAGVIDGRAGLRSSRSKRLVGAERCLVAHPLLVELLSGPRYGVAREVLLRCGATTGERLAATTPAGGEADLPPDVSREQIHEVVDGATWRISARSFFQSRVDGAEALSALVADAAGGLGDATRALDLYSGVGIYAGVLADRGWAVTAVEGSSSSVADAEENLSGRGVSVVRADVTRWQPGPAELVVADPSRNGLGVAGANVVAASGARRVVLISCDSASLGRDVGLLTRKDYRVTSVTPVDMFPHTFRVEVVTVLDRF